jgi:nicotinamide riboside transporter PnuC
MKVSKKFLKWMWSIGAILMATGFILHFQGFMLIIYFAPIIISFIQSWYISKLEKENENLGNVEPFFSKQNMNLVYGIGAILMIAGAVFHDKGAILIIYFAPILISFIQIWYISKLEKENKSLKNKDTLVNV